MPDALWALLCHELWHQWFPGKAVLDRPTSTWLSEAMVAYFDSSYIRNSWPPFRAGFPYPVRYVASSYSIEQVCTDHHLWTEAAGEAIHIKGAWVVHMLRGLIGERAFRETIREFYGDTSPWGRPTSTR